MDRAPLLSTVGAVGSAVASALCCVGPLLYVSLGVGAGLASTFEPLRPWFLAGAVVFLGTGFYAVYGRRARCAPGDDGGEAVRAARRREEIVLWTGTVAVVVFATFPVWSNWLT